MHTCRELRGIASAASDSGRAALTADLLCGQRRGVSSIHTLFDHRHRSALQTATPANLGLHADGGQMPRSRPPHCILARKDPFCLGASSSAPTVTIEDDRHHHHDHHRRICSVTVVTMVMFLSGIQATRRLHAAILGRLTSFMTRDAEHAQSNQLPSLLGPLQPDPHQ